jgi:hypothetical protein
VRSFLTLGFAQFAPPRYAMGGMFFIFEPYRKAEQFNLLNFK